MPGRNLHNLTDTTSKNWMGTGGGAERRRCPVPVRRRVKWLRLSGGSAMTTWRWCRAESSTKGGFPECPERGPRVSRERARLGISIECNSGTLWGAGGACSCLWPLIPVCNRRGRQSRSVRLWPVTTAFPAWVTARFWRRFGRGFLVSRSRVRGCGRSPGGSTCSSAWCAHPVSGCRRGPAPACSPGFSGRPHFAED